MLLIELEKPDLISEAWDYVSGRSGGDMFTARLVSDLKPLGKEQRSKWAALVGVSSLEGDPSDAVLERAFLPLESSVAGDKVLSTLLSSPNQRFLTEYLKRYHARIPGAAMIALLSNPDKVIRISAIQAIKDVNETPVLQIVLEAYAAEQDPDVRKEYQQLWIIKQRMAP